MIIFNVEESLRPKHPGGFILGKKPDFMALWKSLQSAPNWKCLTLGQGFWVGHGFIIPRVRYGYLLAKVNSIYRGGNRNYDCGNNAGNYSFDHSSLAYARMHGLRQPATSPRLSNPRLPV